MNTWQQNCKSNFLNKMVVLSHMPSIYVYCIVYKHNIEKYSGMPVLIQVMIYKTVYDYIAHLRHLKYALS